jgi:hypothetical protein
MIYRDYSNIKGMDLFRKDPYKIWKATTWRLMEEFLTWANRNEGSDIISNLFLDLKAAILGKIIDLDAHLTKDEWLKIPAAVNEYYMDWYMDRCYRSAVLIDADIYKERTREA